jgi:hypothetical protein
VLVSSLVPVHSTASFVNDSLREGAREFIKGQSVLDKISPSNEAAACHSTLAVKKSGDCAQAAGFAT